LRDEDKFDMDGLLLDGWYFICLSKSCVTVVGSKN